HLYIPSLPLHDALPISSTVLLAEKPTPDNIFEVLHRHRPTVFFAVPAVYAAMLQAAEKGAHCDLSSLRCAVSAGEALPAPLWERDRKSTRLNSSHQIIS